MMSHPFLFKFHSIAKLSIVTLAVLVGLKVVAAPLPVSSTSLVFQIEKEIYRSPLGFSVHAAKSGWVLVDQPKGNPFIETVYKAKDSFDDKAALTVRSDKSGKAKTIDEYVSKWLKDYPRFGFQILNSKKVKVGKEIGFMLDLVNHDNHRQLRQVIFLKGKNVVTLTCRDETKAFSTTLKSCNEIMRTFRW